MTDAEPEFSRLVARGEIVRGEVTRDIEAEPAERAALAERFGLVALDRLEATLRLRPKRGGQLLSLEGRLKAAVIQRCVVTLEDLPAAVEDEVSRLYTLASGETDPAPGVEIEVDAEGEDPPEPIGPRGIDLGEVVAEQLGLALDPYPRAPGAALELAQEGGAAARDDEETKQGPFAALAALKDRD